MGLGWPGGVTVRKTSSGRPAPHEGHATDGRAQEAASPVEAGSATVALDVAAQGSPLIAQYGELKAQHPEALLLSRVGDFYEAYGADASELADAVKIILTSKECGKGCRVAMAGVPHHHLDRYLAKLLRQRRVVAIAEQMEPPAANRLVRREVLRVLTPGTVLEDQFLVPESNNYICALAVAGGMTAVASADVSTASAAVCIARDDDELACELDRIEPAELIVEAEEDVERIRPMVGEQCRIALEDGEAVGEPVKIPEGFAREEQAAARAALGLLACYLDRLKLDGRAIMASAARSDSSSVMTIDPATRRHLDLLQGSGENRSASLLAVLSRTRSPMGSRLLTSWLCAPSLDVQLIRARHDRVAFFVDRPSLRFALQGCLAKIGDVERIVSKVAARRAGPRDLAALRASLEAAARLRAELERSGDEACVQLAAATAADGVLERLAGILETALVDDPPPLLADGGAIRPDHSAELGELVKLRAHARDRLLGLEEETRARTGIKALKIRYTQAFGYYYEVTRAQAASMPASFLRRQSLVNAERFTDGDLKQLESDILTARTRQIEVERVLFEALLVKLDAVRHAILGAARAIAQTDVYCSLAQVAGERRYVRPTVVAQSVLHVENGRHPILETFGGVDFVPNDCHIDAERRFLCITGPNMGGKSTFLRQAALLAVLAQIGSFVPATRATIGLVERLFTRIGAGDDIAAGRSTFYVEMAEMALILRRCTPRSLLLIDEVGRGTGTTDGLAIAQAISEYLLRLDSAMPMILFATHFHELVSLSSVFPMMENLHVAVADEEAGPVFSHRLLPGSSNRSYGIAVAKMAGLPEEVVARAGDIAAEIERRPQPQPRPARHRSLEGQLELDV